MSIHESIAQAVPQIARGKVWCTMCNRMQYVDGAEALRNGWPKCCGATMTIDSPEWRTAHARVASPRLKRGTISLTPVEQQMHRIVCHFSCGAASAIATKLILREYPVERVVIYNAFLVEEDEDNRRFLADCEQWFNHPIIVLRDEKSGASAETVWRKHRFMVNGIWGAPCSSELKRDVIEAYCTRTDLHVVGYTIEERHRIARFIGSKGERQILTPLIDRNLSHNDCLSMIERAGIVLPRMYALGFNNANCKGCPKGGEGYWNKVRLVFPEVFQARLELQEWIGPGAYFFRDRKTGERFGLKDLKPNAGRHEESLPDCSFFCDLAEQEIRSGS